jgi:hypothetical protein
MFRVLSDTRGGRRMTTNKSYRMNFKQGEWEKAREVILFDLEKLRDCEIKEDWEEAFDTLKGNIIDLYGLLQCANCQAVLDQNSEDLYNSTCMICKGEAC